MSVHLIYCQNGAKYMRPISSQEELRQLRDSERQRQLVAQARGGASTAGAQADAKRQLLQFNYSCLPNRDGTLKSSTRLSGSVGMDIDIQRGGNESHAEFQARLSELEKKLLSQAETLQILLLERSATKGYHVVLKRNPKMTQVQNLQHYSRLLGVQYDEGAKDHTRVFFASTASPEDLLYLSPELFDNETEYECVGALDFREAPDFGDSGEAPDSGNSGDFAADYDGIPYALLVECLAEQLGGVPVHGSRNNFLFSMACHLRYVCNDDPVWIGKVLPTYGEDSERLSRTIQSACNRAQSREMPALVQRAISVARGQNNLMKLSSVSNNLNPVSGTTPPEMPKKLPKLISLLVSKVDPMYRPAVAQAVFPPLGAHLHGVRTRYIDNSENDLGGFMSVLMAKQSIGKGAVNMPIELIMEDVRHRDSFYRDQEKQWKQQCKSAKASEKKPARPEGLCVQYLMPNMTNAAMVQRLIDAQLADNRFLYVKLDEIELLDQIKATGGTTASELIRLAFTQSLYGQERVGQDSVTGAPPLRFNFNASTTIPGGMSYFHNGLTNGTLSRMTFSTIIKPVGKRGIPRFGDYDVAFRSALAPFITNLGAASGLVECRQAERLANQLMEENCDFAELSDDDVLETLSYRANRIAYDKAMLLFIAHGYKWSKEIADFCRWSEQYDLWCKLHFFGQAMREQVQTETLSTAFGPRNMLDLLPDRFTRQDLQAVHRAQGKDGNVMQVIYNWTARGYIEQDTVTQEFIKTGKYLSKHKPVLS